MRRANAPGLLPRWWLAGAILLLLERDGAAEGFALNRFEPSERGSDWFGLESLDFRGHGRWSTGIVGDWAHRPLVLYDAAGEQIQAVLEEQVHAYVGGSVVLADRYRVALSFPLILVNQGDPPAIIAPEVGVTSGANVGDLRLSGDVRILGEYRSAITLAAGAHLYLPTGNRAAFSGDETVRAQPHLLAAGRLGGFEYAAKSGVNVRGTSEFVGLDFGSEWMFAVAGGVRLADDRLLLGPEVRGGTVIDSSVGAFDTEGTPMEALLGAHYRLDEWMLGLGAGPGLSRGLGTPQLRALASVEWVRPHDDSTPPVSVVVAPADSDGDSVLDVDDACPRQSGVQQRDPRQHGCPLPLDSDADGIADSADACLNERGVPSADAARHGCPAPPEAPAPPIDCSTPGTTLDASGNPCPGSRDRDSDGIDDEQDACIDRAGPAAADPAQNGCPRVRLDGDRLQTLDRVEFENAQAKLRPESDLVLSEVAKLLLEHPEIRHLDIQGHTDDRGASSSNLELSRNRAAAVKDWLIRNGVAAERLTSRGFGEERPIDSNATDTGRQRNRRVEFHVVADEPAQAP